MSSVSSKTRTWCVAVSPVMALLLLTRIWLVEPDGRRNDDMGIHMPFPMVQENIYRAFRCPSSSADPPICPSQILFLNKNDLFQERIALSPISKYFPVRGLPCFCLVPPLTTFLDRIMMAHQKTYARGASISVGGSRAYCGKMGRANA